MKGVYYSLYFLIFISIIFFILTYYKYSSQYTLNKISREEWNYIINYTKTQDKNYTNYEYERFTKLKQIFEAIQTAQDINSLKSQIISILNCDAKVEMSNLINISSECLNLTLDYPISLFIQANNYIISNNLCNYENGSIYLDCNCEGCYCGAFGIKCELKEKNNNLTNLFPYLVNS